MPPFVAEVFFGVFLAVISSRRQIPPLLSPPLHVSCMATFHTGTDVSCCAVWEKDISLQEYEQQMARDRTGKKKKGVSLKNVSDAVRQMSFSTACVITYCHPFGSGMKAF